MSLLHLQESTAEGPQLLLILATGTVDVGAVQEMCELVHLRQGKHILAGYDIIAERDMLTGRHISWGGNVSQLAKTCQMIISYIFTDS